jgi:diguanylate cyclase (GGDEF)-like protein
MNQISPQQPFPVDRRAAPASSRIAAPTQAAILREALLTLEDGVILLDPRLHIVLCNVPARLQLGCGGDPPPRGLPLAALLATALSLDVDARATVMDRCVALNASSTGEAEARITFAETSILIRRLDGRRLLLLIAASCGRGQASLHDPLTGLGNRRLFQAALAAALAKPGAPASLLMLDLDRFKQVNDTLGHPVGDALLRLVGQRLRSCLRQDDVVVRLGGDEFAILLPHFEAVDTLAERLIDLLSRPYLVEGHLANIGVSIGVAFAPADADDPGTLLRHADLALYGAKAAGRHCIRFFKPEMNARAQARLALETDLRRATALNQFALHYQPLLDIASGRVTEFEALLRWQHPTRGTVPPAEFIPLAEELGLIVQIGEWVLRQACRTAVTWPEDVRVAVNVSPIQFSDGHRLVCAVSDALATSGLAGRRLEVEITETVLLNNTPDTLATLHALRALGVSIAMDDFGTGYSSLSQLRSFPFDKVKIDRSFVSQIDDEGGSGREVVRAIASLGANLGMTVTVEGIETNAQADFVETTGGHQMQGYLISRPVPSDMVAALFSPKAAGR